MFNHFLALSLSCSILALGGCERKQSPSTTTEAPAIPVAHPRSAEVTDYVEFTGRTDAVQAVDIRARVTGFLIRMPFREGGEVRGDDRLRQTLRILGSLAAPTGQGPFVAATHLSPGQGHEGDLLFEIDPRPYQAQFDQAKSQVVLNEASLQLARTTLERDRAIGSSVRGGVSQQQLDQEQAAVDEAIARVRSFQASTELYKLNLGYTRVTSPIDGQASRYYQTAGNVVIQDSTLLTTVVSLDPMYAYFDMDDATWMRIKRAIDEGTIQLPQDGVIPVRMALPGEDDYLHEGRINFVNNQLNPTTGSISVRGIFPNPKSARGIRRMSPGMFVRLWLPIGQPHEELLVKDQFIQSDQGNKYVYVLDADNKVQTRKVSTGALQSNGLRVVRGEKPGEGVKPDDWIVVGALQQVRPRMVVEPQRLKSMPALNEPAEEAPKAAEPKK